MSTSNTEKVDLEPLLTKLRESRLPTDERRSSLETLRQALAPLTFTTFTLPSSESRSLAIRAIHDGPNDVRRVVLQSIASCIEKESIKADTGSSALSAVHELVDAIDTFLRSTLKVSSSQPISVTRTRPSFDVSTFSTSALRAIAAALKTLHALIRFLPKQDKLPVLARGISSKPSSLSSLFNVLLPCLFAGILTSQQMAEPAWRIGSGLQSGAFSWGDHARQRHAAAQHAQDHAGTASEADTDRKSDKSESERSDFSVTSTASRTRKDGSRQEESLTKAIRQNALHCLIELNHHESRALISRWGELLPDQPALPQASQTSDTSAKAAFAARRPATVSPTAQSSLCTLIVQDPSTSVRIAAMAALESILSHGTLQLSMAQERAQRALSFTSLSQQLAGWIVNIRSYLVVALQRAATAPRAPASARAERSGQAAGQPSSLVVALLQLTRAFAMSTAKAKLVHPNAAVLGPVVVPFATHSDPDVQAAAKRLLATLTATSDVSTTSRSILRTSATAPSNRAASDATDPLPSNAPMDVTALLSENSVLTGEVCERMLVSLESTTNGPDRNLTTWSVLINRLAEASTPLLSADMIARLVATGRRICVESGKTPDERCAILAANLDLWRYVSKHARLGADTALCILDYVQSCSRDEDEAVRAAAVRALGLLILPTDAAVAELSLEEHDQHLERVSSLLQTVLWGSEEEAQRGALQDNSSLVRQRAAWAFSNAMEARLRSACILEGRDWVANARYCIEAGKDIEGVAVSALRASGSLLAMMPTATSTEAASLGRMLLEQLCRVLGNTLKPPKSRWNAASALDRALGSDVVLNQILQPTPELMDRIIETLCSNLNVKVFKIRVSAANALLSVCLAADKSESHASDIDRLQVLGEQRYKRIHGVAEARLAELNDGRVEPTQSKESAMYVDELKRLLSRLVVSSVLPQPIPVSAVS